MIQTVDKVFVSSLPISQLFVYFSLGGQVSIFLVLIPHHNTVAKAQRLSHVAIDGTRWVSISVDTSNSSFKSSVSPFDEMVRRDVNGASAGRCEHNRFGHIPVKWILWQALKFSCAVKWRRGAATCSLVTHARHSLVVRA